MIRIKRAELIGENGNATFVLDEDCNTVLISVENQGVIRISDQMGKNEKRTRGEALLESLHNEEWNEDTMQNLLDLLDGMLGGIA